jgi:hypothetical protein
MLTDVRSINEAELKGGQHDAHVAMENAGERDGPDTALPR